TSPTIYLAGYQIGALVGPQLRLTGHTWSLRDDFTMVLSAAGRHDVKIGGDLLYNYNFLVWNPQRNGSLYAILGPIPSNIEDLFPVWNDSATWNLAPLSPISRVWLQSFPTCSSVTGGCGYSYPDTPVETAGWVQDNWAI